jgi:hypothetical protein
MQLSYDKQAVDELDVKYINLLTRAWLAAEQRTVHHGDAAGLRGATQHAQRTIFQVLLSRLPHPTLIYLFAQGSWRMW